MSGSGGSTFDVPDVSGKLGNEIQITICLEGLLSGAVGEGKD